LAVINSQGFLFVYSGINMPATPTEIDVTQIRPGTAYQIVGTNSGATADTYLTLSAGTNISITPSGTTLTVASTGGKVDVGVAHNLAMYPATTAEVSNFYTNTGFSGNIALPALGTVSVQWNLTDPKITSAYIWSGATLPATNSVVTTDSNGNLVTTNVINSAITISPTSNQLVLGTTHTTTLSATAPSASRTYTLPDTGANSSFVMTDGSQTINGATSFTSRVSIAVNSGQLFLGEATGNGYIIDSGTPASTSRTLSFVDPGANANIVLSQGSQTLAGVYTFSGGSGAVTLSGSTIAMGSNKITSLANGSASADAVNYSQLKVLQTVYNLSSGAAVSTTSTSFVATHVTATITPTSASNRILILTNFPINLSSTTIGLFCTVTIFRGSTDIAPTGTGPGIAILTNLTSSSSTSPTYPVTLCLIDSPATTSSVTYTVEFKVNNASLTATAGALNGSNAVMPMILMEVV
jgi:hypothetical protein